MLPELVIVDVPMQENEEGQMVLWMCSLVLRSEEKRRKTEVVERKHSAGPRPFTQLSPGRTRGRNRSSQKRTSGKSHGFAGDSSCWYAGFGDVPSSRC